jgi:hypothetical protein
MDELDERGPLEEHSRCLRSFMLTICALLTEHLPPRSAHWLALANAYGNGAASDEDLKAAQVEAWTHLGPHRYDFSRPDVNAIRAVICTLFPDGPDPHLFENMLFFFEFCAAAGVDREEQHRLLQATFADVLE